MSEPLHLQPGDWVRIKTGIWSDVEGKVMKVLATVPQEVVVYFQQWELDWELPFYPDELEALAQATGEA
jgi:hypothetical protein